MPVLIVLPDKLPRYPQAPASKGGSGGGYEYEDSGDEMHVPEDAFKNAVGRRSHSSTFRLNVSTFCGTLCVCGRGQ